MITPKQAAKSPSVRYLPISGWPRGVMTALDDRRMPTDGLRLMENMLLDQDSIVHDRPGTIPYGPRYKGKVLGQTFEMKSVNGTNSVTRLVNIQVIDGVGRVCIARGEDEDWQVITTKSYNANHDAHFLQLRNKVAIMNGNEPLSFLDTDSLTITALSPISDPEKPTLKENTGLTGTAFKVFYAVVAHSTIGQSMGSPVLEVPVITDRDTWDAQKQKIAIKWTTVAGVKSWSVYAGVGVDGDGVPSLGRIATGLPPDQLTFEDNGSRAIDVSTRLPQDNTTAGPIVARGRAINGRAWFVGDKADPWRVWHGGDPGHEFDLSPSNGGGVTHVLPGSKNIPLSVEPYRDGKGDPQVTVLCRETNGLGRRVFIRPNQIEYGGVPIVIWETAEDTGTDGTDSPDSVVIYNNDLHYISRDGGKNTGTLPQLQAVLSTRRTTNTIQDKISLLNTDAISKIVGVAFEGRIYWSLPVGSKRNNQIWVLDTERGGAWSTPWTITADWLLLYNDNSGRTRLLASDNDKGLYEFSSLVKTRDGDEPFSTAAQSGQIQFSKDRMQLVRLLRVIFVLMRPQGTINFNVTCMTNNGTRVFNKSKTFIARSSQLGWGEAGTGWGRRGWSRVKKTPKTSTLTSVEFPVKVGKDVQWAQYGWHTTEPGVSYGVSEVIFEYVPIGPRTR